jgi:outer membrane receptor protein involved in Fe transport
MGGMGSLVLQDVLGYIDSWEQEEYDGAGITRCEGRYGGACDTPTADFRNRFAATWYTPWNLALNLTWRHTAGIDQISTGTSPANNLDSVDYFDLAGNWQATEWLNIRAGVNNLFDKEPPFVSQGVTARENGNTYPGAYDALGQYWFFAASVEF